MENQIKNAVAHFEQLLREQIARAENLNAARKQKDENKTVIGFIDGDGITYDKENNRIDITQI